jgi:predicted peroxiredoxin
LKLGILVNTDRHLDHLVGLANAAASKGHQVIVFFMDDGVNILTDPLVNELSKIPDIEMNYCDYSTQRTGMSTDGVSDNIGCGSQFNNATMNHDADRVIVL